MDAYGSLHIQKDVISQVTSFLYCQRQEIFDGLSGILYNKYETMYTKRGTVCYAH